MSAKLDMKSGKMVDPESLLQHRAYHQSCQKIYALLGVSVPVIVGSLAFIINNSSACVRKDEDLIADSYAWVDLVCYMYSLLYFVLNVRQARVCMKLLDIPPICSGSCWSRRGTDDPTSLPKEDGTEVVVHAGPGAPPFPGEVDEGPKGTIRENAIVAHYVYLGMFLVFGILRFPRQIVNVYEVLHLPISNQLRCIEAWFVPMQGALLFAWFSKKFHYRTLWLREFRRLRARRRPSRPVSEKVVETISGMF